MSDAVFLSSTIMLGLYAGSLLTEAVILVPYWRKMNADDFFQLHGSIGPRLFRYFAPLTILAVVLALCATLIDGFENVARLISAILSLAALLIFFVYFKNANRKFAAHLIETDALTNELRRWSVWHWMRTTMILVAFVSSVGGHLLATGI